METEDGPKSDATARLRPALLTSLGLLSIFAVLSIASELIAHLTALFEAQRALASHTSQQPAFVVAQVPPNVALMLEAAVLEPVLLLAMVGLWHLATRGSYALALTGLVAFNVAVVGLIVAGPVLGVGSSPVYAMGHVIVPLIGLPIAEFALWALLRKGERHTYRR